MSYSRPNAAAAIPDEFASCTGTDAGCGVAVNTTYTATAPNHDAAGSLIPAVTLGATNATTSTVYEVDFPTPATDTDMVFLEVYQATGQGLGWMLLGTYIGSASWFSNATPVGMWFLKTATGWRVGFSNAGRTSGLTYGTAKDDWIGPNSLGWRWRLRKVAR